MSELQGLLTLEYHKNRYTVATLKYSSDTIIPILLDREMYKKIRNLNKKWYINEKNHVYCFHNQNGKVNSYPVYLHEIVMKLNKKYLNKPIIHINNIHFDNRIENLQHDIRNKDHSKNTKKKNRTIDLSEHGIQVDALPTYLWYLKPDSSHGDRFNIDVPGQIHWRSTSSRKVSLKYKLEESKKYLRHIKKTRPDIFESFSMNGDMTSTGNRLYKEYMMMIKKAGFTMNNPENNRTDEFLRQSTSNLSTFEIYLLHNFNPAKGSIDVKSLQHEYREMMK